MMLLPDKKKATSIILEKIKPKMDEMESPKEMESSEVKSDLSMAKEDAAKKMIQALESKDAKMLASALQDFMDMYEEVEDQLED